MIQYREMKVWEKAHELCLQIFRQCLEFPKADQWFAAEVRQAALAIPCRIVEGCGRTGDADLAKYFDMARGSAARLEYYLLLARDLDYLPVKRHDELLASLTEVEKMLTVFVRKVRERINERKRKKSAEEDQGD